MEINGMTIEWLGHASFRITSQDIVIYIDPYEIAGEEPKADIILVTHSHYDHCSPQDIEKIAKEGTIVFLPADAQSKLSRISKELRLELAQPGFTREVGGVTVIAVPAYNTNKDFHPRDEEWLGYIVRLGNVAVYHAGDTDIIDEMQDISSLAKAEKLIALLPVGGTYTMNADEAARAASIIKPTIAVPMHYGSIVGTREDAERFRQLCEEQGIQAVVMEPPR